jgi:hypothetical protein
VAGELRKFIAGLGAGGRPVRHCVWCRAGEAGSAAIGAATGRHHDHRCHDDRTHHDRAAGRGNHGCTGAADDDGPAATSNSGPDGAADNDGPATT